MVDYASVFRCQVKPVRLRLLDARGVALSPEQRQRVTSNSDPAQLNPWFDRAITAGTATEVFAD